LIQTATRRSYHEKNPTRHLLPVSAEYWKTNRHIFVNWEIYWLTIQLRFQKAYQKATVTAEKKAPSHTSRQTYEDDQKKAIEKWNAAKGVHDAEQAATKRRNNHL